MLLILLSLGYGVGITMALTVVGISGEYFRYLYHNVLWDPQSLERLRKFFQTSQDLLQLISPVIDRLDPPRGRHQRIDTFNSVSSCGRSFSPRDHSSARFRNFMRPHSCNRSSKHQRPSIRGRVYGGFSSTSEMPAGVK